MIDKNVNKKENKSKTDRNIKKPEKKKSASAGFPIVGIGASAGGLEALEQFFSKMPEDCGMAFVVIQHLDPTHKGIMPELLQRITPMKVLQADDGLAVKPGSVYVIPPNKSLSMLNHRLHLFDPVESRGLRLPVDFFLRSLALDQLDKSIGIILSGMGSDGSLGVKAVKEKNGLVLVQTPGDAKFDSMPRSAVESVIADAVAPAAELPAMLIDLLKFIPPAEAESDLELDGKVAGNLEKIIILLREHTGHDFSQYKRSTLLRRIERRKGVHQIDKISNYVRFLQENPFEIDILFKELLIGVTAFFRDPKVWEKVGKSVLTELMNELPSGYILRAWVAGCSTGEEAYSLAMIFHEALDDLKKHKKLTMQIFATDIDVDAIEKARGGFFPSNIVADVSPERLARFFIPEGEGFRVKPAIREMIVFANQNAIKDPPFTKLDILTCRNMLIYMEPELQKKLMTLFRYSLNPGGIMILGSAETIGPNNEEFDEIDSRLKIFRRSLSAAPSMLSDFPSSFSRKNSRLPERRSVQKTDVNIQSVADQVLLQRFAPASVMVNSKGDILYITGRTGKYLEPSAGKANMNIHAMAREGLREALPGALRKAMQILKPVKLSGVRIGSNGGTQLVDVTLQRLDSPEAVSGMIIVIFADVASPVKHDTENLKTGSNKSTLKQKELEIELKRSYEDLQSAHEEMQTSQEELKSTNEELQSSNEELQSSNEELTTSKEEMQSLNEELQTVNIELQNKISDYVQANNDMKNLLNSTEIATLFLDKGLNIRRFTDNLTDIIKIRNSDINRPFTDLVTDLQYPEIESHARQVLKTLISIETSISTNDGRWYRIRVMPYRTYDDRIDGIVMTFSDITAAKHVEAELAIAESRLLYITGSVKYGILLVDGNSGEIIEANPFFLELFGYPLLSFMGKHFWEMKMFKDIAADKDSFFKLWQNQKVCYENLPLEKSGGGTIIVEFTGNVYSADKHKLIQCMIREKDTA